MKRWAFRLFSVLLTGLLVSASYADDLNELLSKGAQALNQGNFGAAEKAYRKALTLNAQQPYALLGLATALNQQGHSAEAKTSLQGLIQRQPGFQPAYYLLGSIYENEGNLDAAKQAYQGYVQHGPVSPDPAIRIKLRKMGVY